MSDVEAFFARYHPGARRNYRGPSGDVLACGLIAGAFVLLTGGQFLHVYGRASGTGSRADIRPRVEDASITWGGHVVCLGGDLIYDVLLPGPVDAGEYMERAFTNSDDLFIASMEGCRASDYYLREMGLALSPTS